MHNILRFLSKFVKVVRNYAQIAMQYKEDFKMSIYSKLNSVAYLFSIWLTIGFNLKLDKNIEICLLCLTVPW